MAEKISSRWRTPKVFVFMKSAIIDCISDVRFKLNKLKLLGVNDWVINATNNPNAEPTIIGKEINSAIIGKLFD